MSYLESLRVTTSENPSKYFADVMMTSSLHHLSNNPYLTANGPFLETLIAGFDISAMYMSVNTEGA